MALTDVSHRHIDLVAVIFAPFRALATGIFRIAELNRRVHRAEFLLSLSDAQLAKRGLRRENIVRTVFADLVSD